MRLNPLLLTASLVALAACAVGHDFERPAAPEAATYDDDSAPEAVSAEQKLQRGGALPAAWWTLFRSKPLDQLIEQALKANPDVAAAEASLRAASEDLLAGGGVLFPTVSGSFSSARQKTSGASDGGQFPGSIYTLHNASVSVSYALDLFGGARRSIEKLEAETDYQRFETEGAYLTLASNVVTTAVQEASLRGQIAATRKVIAEQTDELKLLRQQLDLGGITKAAVLEQATTLAQTKATLPALEQQLATTRHSLSALCGEPPNDKPNATFELADLKLPANLPVSLPSQLVEQRPDIRAAEANLHAASAAIGVAEANRLPQIALSADIGDVANNLSKMFYPGSGIWSLGASATQTLFDAGTLEHEQRSAEAEYDVAAAQYRKTVLAAFQNVADTLVALRADAATLLARQAAAEAATNSLTLVRTQFNAGASSHLDLLNAEVAEQQTQIALVQAEAQRFADTAALFQALGGGWWNKAPAAADAAQALPPHDDDPTRAAKAWQHKDEQND